ncbi:hypothetical protein PsorP6_007120 [Peronosclerospora sorghi]|uniref:Uncharacterized protein n=1 Tax=Peronosclerospora sorghi TaxID=230839 RepID=A0ACC0W8X4_9STRA|nr:hypothetical protein PsorP6_007120 [Peronosclerospora sorghi]
MLDKRHGTFERRPVRCLVALVDRIELSRLLQHEIRHACESLERRSAREIARPILMTGRSIGQEIVRLDAPREPERAFRVRVIREIRVEHMHAGILVDIVKEFVHVLEPLTGIVILKVAAHGEKHVVPSRHVASRLDRRNKVVHDLAHVIVMEHGIVLDLIRRIAVRKVVGRTVRVNNVAGKDLRSAAPGLARAPEHFELLVVAPRVKVLIVDATEVERVQADAMGQERPLRGRVPKRINLPPNAWTQSKLVHEKRVAICRLINHGNVVRRGFIVHDPAPIRREIEPPFVHEALDHALHGRALFVPPALEERLLDKHKASVRVPHELLDRGIQNVLYFLDIVLVHVEEPAGIVMRVGNEMDIELRWIDATRGVVDAVNGGSPRAWVALSRDADAQRGGENGDMGDEHGHHLRSSCLFGILGGGRSWAAITARLQSLSEETALRNQEVIMSRTMEGMTATQRRFYELEQAQILRKLEAQLESNRTKDE